MSDNTINNNENSTTEVAKTSNPDFPNRTRNKLIITLCEGDVLLTVDGFNHVTEGEIHIYANGKIDMSAGEMAACSAEGVRDAEIAGKTIFNLEDAV